MLRIAQILCPIDFSEFSGRALDQAAALAVRHGATLAILYVFRNVPVMDGPPLALNEIDRYRLTRKMRRFAALLPPQIAVDFRIEEAADIHLGILAQAAAIEADLLVIGAATADRAWRATAGNTSHPSRVFSLHSRWASPLRARCRSSTNSIRSGANPFGLQPRLTGSGERHRNRA